MITIASFGGEENVQNDTFSLKNNLSNSRTPNEATTVKRISLPGFELILQASEALAGHQPVTENIPMKFGPINLRNVRILKQS